MKFILVLAVCAFAVTGYTRDSIQSIYKKARVIFCENDYGDDQRLLFAHYSKAIKRLDEKTLMQNPELVFRKALACFAMLDPDELVFEDFKIHLTDVRNDFEFVTMYATSGSTLYSAADLRKQFIDFVLSADPQSMDDLIRMERIFWEAMIKVWVPGSSGSRKELREQLFENLQQSSELLELFSQFIVLLEDDAELVLGYVKPDEIQILGVTISDEDQEPRLSYVIKYSYPNGYEMTIETDF